MKTKLVIGVDGGGTLVKVSIFHPNRHPSWEYQYFNQQENIDIVAYVKRLIEQQLNHVESQDISIALTGGFANKWAKAFCLQGWNEASLMIVDEIDAFSHGVQCILEETNHNCDIAKDLLLVSAGTGASFIDLHLASDKMMAATRIGGTAIAGGAFLGLGTRLTNELYTETDYQQLMAMAESALHTNSADQINLTVGDIYDGNGYASLDAKAIAGYFAKLASKLPRKEGWRNQAVYSLLRMICFNIAQLAFVYARLYKKSAVMMGGGFFVGELPRRLFYEAGQFLNAQQSQFPQIIIHHHLLPSSLAKFVACRGAAEKLLNRICDKQVDVNAEY